MTIQIGLNAITRSTICNVYRARSKMFIIYLKSLPLETRGGVNVAYVIVIGLQALDQCVLVTVNCACK